MWEWDVDENDGDEHNVEGHEGKDHASDCIHFATNFATLCCLELSDWSARDFSTIAMLRGPMGFVSSIGRATTVAWFVTQEQRAMLARWRLMMARFFRVLGNLHQV